MTPEEQDLIDLIKQMNTPMSGHLHTGTAGSVNTGTITTNTVPVGQAPYTIQASNTGNPYGFQAAPTMTISAGYTLMSTDLDEAPDLPFSDDPDIPSECFEMESMSAQGVYYTIRFTPESTITTRDMMKCMMMWIVEDPVLFSAYEYIKKHNLERHFTFTEQR